MNLEERAEDEAACAMRTRVFSLDRRIEFFRQAGGCLEINQFDEPTDQNWSEQECVHICEDEIPQFFAELRAFVQEVPGESTSDPDWKVGEPVPPMHLPE